MAKVKKPKNQVIIPNVGENVEQLELSYIASGNEK